LVKVKEFLVVGIYRGKNDFILNSKLGFNRLIKWDMSEVRSFLTFETTINKIVNEYEFKKIVFINNASTIKPIGKIENFEFSDIVSAINANQVSSMLITKALLKFNLELEVLNITSGAADNPIPGWSIYCTTKSANKMFFNVLENQYENVKVNHFDPGILDTNMQNNIRSSDISEFSKVEKFVEFKKNNLLKNPEDVAKDIIFRFFK
jgi:benzil reductase ((S)-benzoin forming)